eukprot:719769_1
MSSSSSRNKRKSTGFSHEETDSDSDYESKSALGKKKTKLSGQLAISRSSNNVTDEHLACGTNSNDSASSTTESVASEFRLISAVENRDFEIIHRLLSTCETD